MVTSQVLFPISVLESWLYALTPPRLVLLIQPQMKLDSPQSVLDSTLISPEGSLELTPPGSVLERSLGSILDLTWVIA